MIIGMIFVVIGNTTNEEDAVIYNYDLLGKGVILDDPSKAYVSFYVYIGNDMDEYIDLSKVSVVVTVSGTAYNLGSPAWEYVKPSLFYTGKIVYQEIDSKLINGDVDIKVISSEYKVVKVDKSRFR